MTATKKIIFSTIIYVLIFISAIIYFVTLSFTGSDAAGNGLARGLTAIYGLVILFVIAIVFVIYNLVISRKARNMGLGVFSFIPIIFPLLILVFEYVGAFVNREDSIEEQSHTFLIEYKSTIQTEQARFSMRTDRGSSSIRVTPEKINDSIFIYSASGGLLYERNRKFQIGINDFESSNFELPIDYKPLIVSFSPWEDLALINSDIQDTIYVSYRYKVEK